MIATCQFCKEIIVGPESPIVDIEQRSAWEYRMLGLMVATHMTQRHMEEAGQEIIAMYTLAGAAIAMRYVDATDPAVHQWRILMGEALIEKFQPAPSAPIRSLTGEN